jgi:hypothetical protein
LPYTVPNRDVALAANPQSLLFQSDFDALAAGIKDTGVLSGCGVTAQGTPDLTLAVASGFVVSAGIKKTVASGNVAIAAADGANPRVDLVYADANGAKAVRTGVAAANPKAPALNAGESLLAMVYVPAGDTAIADNQITDKRVFVSQHGSDQHVNVVSGPTFVRKAADETVNNSAALQNDDHLKLAMLANEVWTFELFLRVTFPSTTCGFSVDFTAPAGASGFYVEAVIRGDGTNQATFRDGPTLGTRGEVPAAITIADHFVKITGVVVNGANAGDFQFRWCQASAEANNLKVLANSWMMCGKLA